MGPLTQTSCLYTRKNAQVVTDLQTSWNKIVVRKISGRVHVVCSQLFVKTVTSMEHVVIILLQG
jgi:hypothetical protein